MNSLNKSTNKKILIIGGTGFLGYHLAKKCLLKKWDVTSISTNRPKKIRFLPKVKYLILDITKKKLLLKKVKSNYDFVVNFGGYVNHNEKSKTYKSHYAGCKNLADLFKNKTVKSFIQIGSSVEYGNTKSPQSENAKTDVKKLKSTYGKAKLTATNYLLKLNKNYNFPCTILRLYLVYGPCQDKNRLISHTLNECLNDNTFMCSAGKQYRDFLFVEDLIRAIFKCFNKKKAIGEVINIGTGKPRNVKKVILLIKNKINLGKPVFGKISLRRDEIFRLYPNISKAKKILNWKPYTSFQKGIETIIRYYKS
jgi:nucleoside-diphosphate-sugar epimerase|tara:strand:+ start:1162 stop:2088 length:927 start_codon:yes stop_codon:yes gene_type:complete